MREVFTVLNKIDKQVSLTQNNFHRLLHYYEPEGILFVNNAKSGCSSVKSALLKAIANREGNELPDKLDPKVVHGENNAWSKNYQTIAQSRLRFSVVRNPFARVLSAYLDKIARPGILRNQFCFQHNRPLDQDISFEAFLDMLSLDETLLDQHYRPQTANLLVGHLGLDAVYYLEGFSQSSKTLARQIGMNCSFDDKRDDHATGAQNKVKEQYSEHARERVIDLYSTDFEVFGYSHDLDEAALAPRSDALKLDKESDEAMRTLNIIGEMKGKNAKKAIRILRESKTPSFSELAAGYRYPALRNSMAVEDVVAEAKNLSRTGNVARRLEAFHVLAESSPDHVSKDEREFVLRQLRYMAPFDIQNHVTYARFLIECKRPEEAGIVVGELKSMTWQGQLVASLQEELVSQSV